MWQNFFFTTFQMISAEAPVLFAKAAEIFVSELSLRAWIHTEDNKRRTLQVGLNTFQIVLIGLFIDHIMQENFPGLCQYVLLDSSLMIGSWKYCEKGVLSFCLIFHCAAD